MKEISVVNRILRNRLFFCCCLLTVVFLGFFAPFSKAANEDIRPIDNQGKKWRIGYLQGQDKADYAENLKGLIEGLMHLGWVEKDNIPTKEQSDKTDYIWKWLSGNAKSRWIEFVGNAYWCSSGEEQKRKENKTAVIERLKKGDIDMMIAMGTWAGQDLVNDSHSTNTIIIDASDPVASGIVKSKEYSGRPYIYAANERDRYKDQIDLFKQEVVFKRLGIVYRDTPDGRAFSAINDVKSKEKSNNFSLVECKIEAEVRDEDLAEKVIQCHKELVTKIDAMYMTSHLEIQKKDMSLLMKPMLEHKVPTWSQAGGWEVEYGALMSFNRPAYTDLGYFQAKVMAKIFRGILPGEISQLFDNPKSKSISLNMETAKIIEFNPSWDVIAAASRIYEKINNSSVNK